MIASSCLLIEVVPSKLKLYFFFSVYALAVLSILLIDDFGFFGIALKSLLILFLLIDAKSRLVTIKHGAYLRFNPDNLIDVEMVEHSYHDLQLLSHSYVSTFMVQLNFLASNSNQSFAVTLFPDSIGAASHSQLRSRLKQVPFN